ncbi:hypothetical protein BSK56_31320, partial [Paenibacillus borealis]
GKIGSSFDASVVCRTSDMSELGDVDTNDKMMAGNAFNALILFSRLFKLHNKSTFLIDVLVVVVDTFSS